MRFNQNANINFELGRNANSIFAEYKDLKIVMGTTEVRGEKKPTLKVWKGKQSKPFSNYYYASTTSRSNRLAEMKQMADDREEYKAKQKAEKKSFNPDLKVGDIYYSSWGYEQTNVSFYQVIEVKGKVTAIFREIAQKQVEDSMESHGMSCNVVAVKDSFLENAEPMQKRVGKYGAKITSCESAWKWDGRPTYKSWYY